MIRNACAHFADDVSDALRLVKGGSTMSMVTDAAGLPVRVTSATGAVVEYSRDAFGRKETSTPPGRPPRLTTVTNAGGLTWSYVYDAAGRPVTERDFDGRSLTYAHDEVGRLVRQVNGAGETIDIRA
ncbi:RHS repeat domain-containing protein [Streptomyces massasporeus]|uniref:RHS repeat domain-containing protein n=1 Tax=Streptomyces massasporeus TaxID=67324 RepID=UPI0033AE55DF